jgi:hypothetical protein
MAVPFQSSAWGSLGHRITGGIAERYLTKKARTEIKKLLGNESIAMVGNWADLIKSDHSYDYLLPWHYINFPAGLNEQTVTRMLQTETSPDLYVKINFLIRELKSKKINRDKQKFYLKLLVHFVADAHQPMHIGRAEDRGGNSIKLYWFNTPTNLHRIWDEQLVGFQKLSYTEHVAAIDFPPTGAKEKWQKQPISSWIYESYKVAEQLYSEVKPEERLSYNYNYQHLHLMNEQFLKGGIRLAGVLNDIFSR